MTDFSWIYRRLTSGSRRLPDFIILGAQRAGTSSLYYYLSQHPQILPAVRKELHFFDDHYRRGLGWYRSQFPTRGARGTITGEATPYYLSHPHAPARIQRLLPQARLIVLLRNPVERAISHYFFEVSHQREVVAHPGGPRPRRAAHPR